MIQKLFKIQTLFFFLITKVYSPFYSNNNLMTFRLSVPLFSKKYCRAFKIRFKGVITYKGNCFVIFNLLLLST